MAVTDCQVAILCIPGIWRILADPKKMMANRKEATRAPFRSCLLPVGLADLYVSKARMFVTSGQQSIGKSKKAAQSSAASMTGRKSARFDLTENRHQQDWQKVIKIVL